MDLNNKLQARLFAGIVVIVTVFLAIGAFDANKKRFRKRLDINFKGPVESMHYDYQKPPYVIVNNKEYDLVALFILDLRYTIQVGDTIIKQKVDLRIKIIKPNTKDTIYNRDPRYKKGY